MQTTIPFSLPDGSSIDVPLGSTYEDALAIAKHIRPDLYQAPPVKQQEGFIPNFGAGVKEFLGNSAYGIGALTGNADKARAAHQAAEKDLEGTKATSWEDVENAQGIGNTASALGGYLRDTTARALPFMGAIGAGAAAGSAAGSFIPGAGNIAGAIAGGIGGAVAGYPALVGQNLARQDRVDPNAPLDVPSAALAAVPQAALNSVNTLFLLGKIGGKMLSPELIGGLVDKPVSVVEAALVKQAQQSLTFASVKGVAEANAIGIPTMLAQTILERAQAGLPLTGDDANKDYKDAAIGAAGIGTVLGPYHGIKARGEAAKQVQDIEAARNAKAQAEAEALDAQKQAADAAFKKSPEGLLALDQQYNDYISQVTDLQKQITALGKTTDGTAEHAQKVALGKQRSDLIQETKKSGLLDDWNANKAAIAIAKLDPNDAWHMREFGTLPAQEDANAPTTNAPPAELGPDEAAATSVPTNTYTVSTATPAPVVAKDQAIGVLHRALTGLRFQAEQTGQPVTEMVGADIAAHLAQQPQAVVAAKTLLDAKGSMAGFDKSQSNMILKETLAQAKKAAEEKAAVEASRQQALQQQADEQAAQRPDLAPTETQPTTPTLPTEAWHEGIQQDNNVAAEGTHTADYAHNWQAERPSAPPLPGAPVAPEPGKVEAFTHREYPATGEVFDYPKDVVEAKLHEAYTNLREEYQQAMADYQRVANTGTPQAVEAHKRVADISQQLDEVAAKINPTRGESTTSAFVRPDIADHSGIDDLLNRALTPAAGNGPPVMAHELEQSVQRLHEIRRDLFTKFTDALSRKTALQAKLAEIPDVNTLNVRGHDVETENRWRAKRAAQQKVDAEVDQARKELVAAAIEEIKKQRELSGKLPHPSDDATLARIINTRLDNILLGQRNKIDAKAPKAAPGTIDHAKETAIRNRLGYVNGRISELHKLIEGGHDGYILHHAELVQLDAEQARLHDALGQVNKEYGTAEKERKATLDRQLAAVNARIRAMQTTDEKGERRITGGASAFGPSEQRAELARLEAARKNILDQQSMSFDDARMHQVLQNIIRNLSINKNLPTRENDVKTGLRKGATGQVNKLRELVLGARKLPGHEVETGDTEFGKAYGLKSGEEPFKASKDDVALVQRMRTDELAQLNDAAKDLHHNDKTRERIDQAIEALHGKLNDPVAREDVARAKDKYKPEQSGTGDLFAEGLPKDVDRASAEYEGAKTATTAGQSEVGRALGGMSLRSLVEDRQMTREEATAKYKAAKERLVKARENLPKLKQQQDAAREEVHAAVESKTANDAMEADANLKAAQRSAAAVMEQLVQRRKAATGKPREELSENVQLLTTLIRELREELRPQLASITNEHGLREADIKSAYEALMPKVGKDAGRNAVERDTANQMHEVNKELTAQSLIAALERSDKQSMAEIDRLLRKIDATEEDGRISTGADLAEVQAKIADLTEKIRVQRDWAAKIKKERAPLARKIAGVEDAISQIKEIVSNMAPAEGKPISEIAKMVMDARKTYQAWQDALNKADERVGVLTRHGVESDKAGIDAEVQKHISEAGKLQDDYYKQLQAIDAAGARDNPTSRKAAEAMERRYEASVERAAEQQKLLESLYAPESRVETKGMWPKEKFGTVEEPPEPTVVRGKYGTANYKDKSSQTSDARQAKADARTQRLAEGKAAEDKPAIKFNGQKEMTILVPEEASTEVRLRLAEWLRSKGFNEAADRIENDAHEITIDNWVQNRTWNKENTNATKESIAGRNKTDKVTIRTDYTEKDLARMQKTAVAQFNAAVKFGESQTAVRPQRSRASSTLNTGAKRGRPTNDAAENRRLGIGPESEGDPDATPAETRVDPNTMFRTGTQAEAKLTSAHAQTVMDAFLAKVPQALRDKIKFFASAKDIPAKMMQELNREGAISEDGSVVKGGMRENGDIIIVGDAHANVADLMETLAHEITGHYGVEKLLGKEGINTLTERLVAQGNVDEIAKSLGLQNALDAAKATSESLDEAPREANQRKVREILAHLEELRPNETMLQKASRFVREVMGAVNAALTKMGLRSPYKVTAADLSHILRQARKAVNAEGDVEGSATVFRKAARQYANPAQEEAATTFIGRNETKMQDVVKASTGLGFRTRFIDSYAGIKEALKRGDPVKAIQVGYDLMTYAQRNNLLYQAMVTGPIERVKSMVKGKEVWLTQAVDGANMKNVAKLLNEVKGFGNPQATSDAFTMYALAGRAKTLGWDRVFADLPKDPHAGPAQIAEIDAVNAARAKARAYADSLFDDANSPFKPAYKEYQDYNKGMLKFAMQSNIISQDEFRRLASTQNYTPLFRADKRTGNLVLEIDQGRDITVGRLADEAHLHKLLGGSGQVMDFFTASARNASVIIEASLHNVASRDAVMSLHAMGLAHPISPTEKSNNTIEFRAPDPKTGKIDLQRFEVETAGTKHADIPADILVKGFAGVPASLPGIVRLLGIPGQFLRKAVTRNPLFMARQLIRDPLSGWLVSGAKFNPVTDTFAETLKSMQGIEDRTLDKRGITGGALFSNDEGDLARIQNEAQKSANWRTIGFYMAALDHGAHAADAVTRRNVYNGAIKAGASDMEASLAAYESMPFSKRGTSPSMRNLNHMVPFLSAAIQGWDVLYRAAKGDMPLADRVNIRNQLLARGGMIAALSTAYAIAKQDDDQYKHLNTSERLNNWVVNGIKVPVPFELGIIFKMLPEALVRSAIANKDLGSELKDVGSAFAGMVPGMMPAAVSPLIEMQLNRSFYTGRDIEGKDIQNVDYSKRFDHNTSELSKMFGTDFQAFGRQWGISPKMLEYMATQYTGGLYQGLAAIIDHALPGTGVKPTQDLAQMPIFRTVLAQEDAGGSVNRLYEKTGQLARTDETYKHLMKANPEEAVSYLKSRTEELGKAKVAEKAKQGLDKFKKIEDAIYANQKLTPDQMQAALKNVQKSKSAYADQWETAGALH